MHVYVTQLGPYLETALIHLSMHFLVYFQYLQVCLIQEGAKREGGVFFHFRHKNGTEIARKWQKIARKLNKIGMKRERN